MIYNNLKQPLWQTFCPNLKETVCQFYEILLALQLGHMDSESEFFLNYRNKSRKYQKQGAPTWSKTVVPMWWTTQGLPFMNIDYGQNLNRIQIQWVHYSSWEYDENAKTGVTDASTTFY